MRIPDSLLPAALLATLLTTAAFTQESTTEETSLQDRLARWELNATVGVPDATAIEELKSLIEAAEADSRTDIADQGRALLVRHITNDTEVVSGLYAGVAELVAQLDEVKLELEIQAALERGDRAFLDSLGKYALPILTRLAIQSDGIPPKQGSLTALSYLEIAAPAEALTVIVSLLESEAPLVRELALEASVRPIRLYSDEVWLPEGDYDWTPANLAWTVIPKRAVNEPGLDPKVLGRILGAVARRGWLDPSAEAAALRLADEGLLNVDVNRVAPRGLWFYERLFESGNARTREQAAIELSKSAYQEVLLKAAVDEAEPVQRVAAKALLVSWVNEYTDSRRSGTSERVFIPEPSPELTSAFKALVTSPSPDIAHAAVSNAHKRIEESGSLPFGGDALIDLVKSVDETKLKWELIGLLKGIPEGERAETVIAAVEHIAPLMGEEARWRAVLNCLYNLPGYGLPSSLDFWKLADALAAWVPVETWTVRERWSSLVTDAIARRDVDAGPMLDWLAKYGLDEHWPIIQKGAGTTTMTGWMEALSAEQRLRLMVELSPRVFGDHGRAIGELIGDAYLPDRNTLERAITDPRCSDLVRVESAEELLTNFGGELDDAWLPVLARSFYLDRPRSHQPGVALGAMTERQRSLMFQLWLSDRDAPDGFVLAMSPPIQDQAMLDRVLQRFPRSSWSGLEGWTRLLEAAVEFAVRRSDEGLHPLLQGDLSELATIYPSLAAAILKHRFPCLQPLAEQILREATDDHESKRDAILAVAGYFNASAANALLEASRLSRDPMVRKEAMEALGEITAWRETARIWSRAADAEVQRADAIGDLVALIEDPAQSVEVRAASIRGLGLLAAAEQLPLIIRGITSDEPEIQAAARAALVRLEKEADR